MKRTWVAASFLIAGLVAPARADTAPALPVAVPFELLMTKHMVVAIKINGKGPYRVIFDTGAPVTLLSNKVGKATGLIGKDGASTSFSLFGPVAQTNAKKLELGGLRAEKVPVIVMDHPSIQVLSDVPGIGPLEGIVGFPFFARYRMTLDYQAKQLTFTPSGYVPADIMQAILTAVMARDKPATRVLAPAGLWGFTVDKKDTDEEAGVTIKQVLPESAAARAGLKAGDRLLTLDDRWTDSVTDCYAATADVKPGTPVSIKIRRDKNELELIVTPQLGL
jgi:hypothetical protein